MLLILYSATSLNQKIARANGSVDWLDGIDHPEGEDYGYHDFYESIGITIMGYNTFKQLIDWGVDWPYADKKNYVLTNKQYLSPHEHVEFITTNHLQRIKGIKEDSKKGIWLIGGGQVNTMLLNAGLIDRIIMHIMPIILPDGIDLFEALPAETKLNLVADKHYSSGVVELDYDVEYQ